MLCIVWIYVILFSINWKHFLSFCIPVVACREWCGNGTMLWQKMDVWSFGCFLYYLLTRHHLFEDDTEAEKILLERAEYDIICEHWPTQMYIVIILPFWSAALIRLISSKNFPEDLNRSTNFLKVLQSSYRVLCIYL